MKTISTPDRYSFLEGGGEMGFLTRTYDWSKTWLGTPGQWPQSLQTTLSILLNSKFPMFLFWGSELLCFYNDAYRPSLGNEGKHPHALGQPAAIVWPEIWEAIKPLIDQVLAGGESTWSEDQLLPIYRNGKLEEVYWTFSYSPVKDESGTPVGVFVACTETTGKVQNLSQLQESRNQLEFAIEATELGTWDLNPLTNKFTANARLKEWFGLLPEEEVLLSLATKVIAQRDRPRVISAIERALQYESGGYYDIDYTIIHPLTGQERMVRAKGRAWFTEEKIAYRFNGTLQDMTSERKAQEEKAAAQHLADLAIKSSGMGLFQVDLATGHIAYNPAYAAIITGDANKKAITREDFTTYVHPEDKLLREAANKLGSETGDFYYQVRVIWEDGSVHRISVMGGLIKDEEGNPVAFSGTVRDITEQEKQVQALKEAEEQFAQALLESEARFRSLVEEAPVATCLFVGPQMRIEVANEVMLGFWGKGPSVIGLPLEEAVPELKGQPFLDILDEVFTTGTIYEARNARAELVVDNTLKTYYFDFTYKPLRDATGQVYGIMDMAVDVTEQVLAKQKMAEAEAILRGAVEMAELATWSLDLATGMISYSERLKVWFGFQGEETLYTTNYNPIAEADRKRIEEAIASSLAPLSSGAFDLEYTTIAYRTGTKRILRAQGKIQVDSSGKPVRLSGTAQDITEQREIQLSLEQQVQQRTEELEATNEELAATNEELAVTNEELIESNGLLIRSNENLQRFAYVASHDLQEPLRKVQQFGDILKKRYADSLGEGVNYVERMQSASTRMSTLIDDLLTFSRISTQRETIEPISLNELVDTILTDLDLVIQETGAVIEADFLPTVQGDRLQLGQLFQNLLSNALKFRRTGVAPRIRIKAQQVKASALPPSVKPTRLAREYHRIEVADNGIGFEEQYLDRIFEVFQRLHGKADYAGTGIGLAICQKVVQNHGGAITARSQLGEGSTFLVYLPI